MKTYTLRIERMVPYMQSVEIEADSAEQAEEIFWRDGHSKDWAGAEPDYCAATKAEVWEIEDEE